MAADGTGVMALPGALAPARRNAAMLAVGLAVALATLDTAIANTALPAIAASLGVDKAASVWVVNAYQIALLAAVLPLAALGEILGHRRVYMAGQILFTLASLGCAVSPTLTALSLMRAMQGLGAAGIMAVNVALIRFIYPPEHLGRGLGINALAVAVCFAAGPTIASLILAFKPWPYLFAVNVPIGIAGFALGVLALPPTPRSRRAFDWLGAALCAALLGVLSLAFGTGAHLASPVLVGAELLVAAAAGAALILRQRGQAAPILPLDLFRRRQFALSAATAVGSFAVQALAFVALPFYFASTLGFSQVQIGFLLTPWPVVVGLLAPVAGRLADRYPPGLLAGAGLAILGIGMALLATMPDVPDSFAIGWRTAICGLGFGLFQAPNLRAIMTSAPPERSGAASGMVAVCRLTGQMTGASLVALCLAVSPPHGAEIALVLGVAFSAMACAASFARLIPAKRG